MDKYIKLLLETESTVILPGLGAIVIEDKDKGTLIFNEYLKFNDGKLDNIIVAESNMDLQEAQNYIAKHVHEIESTISKGEKYSIFGLGDFTKTTDGHIEFEGLLSGQINTSTADIQGPSPTPPPKHQNEEKSIDSASVEKSSNEEEVDSLDEKKDSSSTATIEPVGIKDNIYIEKAEVEHKNAEKESKSAKKTKKEKSPKKSKSKEKGQKRKKGSVFTWIALFLLLIVSGLAVYIGLNYDQFKEMMGWDKFENIQEVVTTDELEAEDLTEELAEGISMETEQTIEQGDLGQEEIIEDIDLKETIVNEIAEEVKVVQPKEQPVLQAATTTTSTSGNIHLIAGAFSEKSNAESLVNDLTNKGHKAQIIDFKNGKHYVSVASFNSVNEAQAHIPNVENDAPGAWIYRK